MVKAAIDHRMRRAPAKRTCKMHSLLHVLQQITELHHHTDTDNQMRLLQRNTFTYAHTHAHTHKHTHTNTFFSHLVGTAQDDITQNCSMRCLDHCTFQPHGHTDIDGQTKMYFLLDVMLQMTRAHSTDRAIFEGVHVALHMNCVQRLMKRNVMEGAHVAMRIQVCHLHVAAHKVCSGATRRSGEDTT